MAGGKNRKKITKMFSPPTTSPPLANGHAPPLAESTGTDSAGASGGEDLLDELMAQMEAKDGSAQAEGAQVLGEVAASQQAEVDAKGAGGRKLSSKDKFKARQARKAEALAASYAPVDAGADARLEHEARAEETAIRAVCFRAHLELWECPPDGNCMFTAVADQLHLLGLLPAAEARPETTRHAAAQYMRAHPDDFLPFLPSVEGEDGQGATDDGLMTAQQFERYCGNIDSTAQWGGQPELLALAKAYGVEIDVVQGGTPSVVKTRPSDDPHGHGHGQWPVAHISYHRRMYGLGEHYNSLRPMERHTIIPHLLYNHKDVHDHLHPHDHNQVPAP
ncbi:cysteine proteinase [Calocera cornea HHB12733]|uniref:Cysteine proteinase n=1 Tax=Calocera cornea HHB12733 TaxID=1353952 RepID=A0A165HV40_9BASI|nr:cysteine proteinase [Calocera cornea HHB12733]